MVSSFVLVNGVQIHYWKTGAGPPLVMLHGLAADGRNWELNAPAIEDLRTVYALDMFNMGRSARVLYAEAGLGAAAAWLGQVLDALGIETTDLIGSSHGGAVCLMFAARNPERVRSMVLFAPANPFCHRPRALIRFWNSWLGGLAARLIPYTPQFLQDSAHRRVYADPGRAPQCALAGYRSALNPVSIAHLRRIVRSWWQDMAQLGQELGKAAAVPVLLIWGAEDAVVGVESAAHLRDALRARLIVLPAVGHLPFVENVEASNRELRKWLLGQ